MDSAMEAAARAIDPVAWEADLPIPTRDDTINFHARRQASNAAAQAAITAYLAAKEAEGFVLVPVEPTEAMVNDGRGIYDDTLFCRSIYRAMIAARPHSEAFAAARCSMTKDETPRVVVTEADREATFSTGLRLTTREWLEVYDAFARHRQSAEAASREEVARLREALEQIDNIVNVGTPVHRIARAALTALRGAQ